MPYLHYTGFELKIGNKMVTKELQSGEMELFIHIFVIMLKKTLSALYTFTMIIVLKRWTKKSCAEHSVLRSPMEGGIGRILIRGRGSA
jgi:hypothetical protein